MAAFGAAFNPESTRLSFKLTHYPAAYCGWWELKKREGGNRGFRF